MPIGVIPHSCTRLLRCCNFFTKLLANFTLHYQKCKLTRLKKNKYTAFGAWILLICFVAGQYMVAVHQHKISQNSGVVYSVSKNQPRPATVLLEKCYMCDAMHHNAVILSQNMYFNPVVVTMHIFKTGDYNFISIALVLAAGRAPPLNSFSC